MARERLRDPTYTVSPPVGLAPYEFEVNHNEEDGLDLTRNMTRQSVTTGPAFVLQQGETGRGAFRFNGTILTQNQYDKIAAYYAACQTRTVFFREHTGTEHEVIITRFNPQRHRTSRNPRAPTLPHYWTYTLEMEVVS